MRCRTRRKLHKVQKAVSRKFEASKKAHEAACTEARARGEAAPALRDPLTSAADRYPPAGQSAHQGRAAAPRPSDRAGSPGQRIIVQRSAATARYAFAAARHSRSTSTAARPAGRAVRVIRFRPTMFSYLPSERPPQHCPRICEQGCILFKRVAARPHRPSRTSRHKRSAS